MLEPKERQSRLGIGVGCWLALLMVSADWANAQVVQVAGENQGEIHGTSARLVASESSRIASRRLMVQFPQTGEPSPSDVSKVGDDSLAQQTELEKTEVKSDIDASLKGPDTSKGITPVQSAGLKLSVEMVNIATDISEYTKICKEKACARSTATR